MPAELGRPLGVQERSAYEGYFGHDLGSVRIHDSHAASHVVQSMDALAFTLGDHVFVDPRRGRAGDGLLAHELSHVVQQRHDHTLGVQHAKVERAAQAPKTEDLQRIEAYLLGPNPMESLVKLLGAAAAPVRRDPTYQPHELAGYVVYFDALGTSRYLDDQQGGFWRFQPSDWSTEARADVHERLRGQMLPDQFSRYIEGEPGPTLEDVPVLGGLPMELVNPVEFHRHLGKARGQGAPIPSRDVGRYRVYFDGFGAPEFVELTDSRDPSYPRVWKMPDAVLLTRVDRVPDSGGAADVLTAFAEALADSIAPLSTTEQGQQTLDEAARGALRGALLTAVFPLPYSIGAGLGVFNEVSELVSLLTNPSELHAVIQAAVEIIEGLFSEGNVDLARSLGSAVGGALRSEVELLARFAQHNDAFMVAMHLGVKTGPMLLELLLAILFPGTVTTAALRLGGKALSTARSVIAGSAHLSKRVAGLRPKLRGAPERLRSAPEGPALEARRTAPGDGDPGRPRTARADDGRNQERHGEPEADPVGRGLRRVEPDDLSRFAATTGVPTEVSDAVEPYDIVIRFDPDDGQVSNVRVLVGRNALPEDLVGHVDAVARIRRFEGFQGRIRRLLARLRAFVGGDAPLLPGMLGHQAREEIIKLEGLARDKIERLSRPDIPPKERELLEWQLADIDQQIMRFEQAVDSRAPGTGTIAVRYSRATRHRFTQVRDEYQYRDTLGSRPDLRARLDALEDEFAAGLTAPTRTADEVIDDLKVLEGDIRQAAQATLEQRVKDAERTLRRLGGDPNNPQPAPQLRPGEYRSVLLKPRDDAVAELIARRIELDVFTGRRPADVYQTPRVRAQQALRMEYLGQPNLARLRSNVLEQEVRAHKATKKKVGNEWVLDQYREDIGGGRFDWLDASQDVADLGHVLSAVFWWNEFGKYLGPRSKQATLFMKHAPNYQFERAHGPGGNRSRGALEPEYDEPSRWLPREGELTELIQKYGFPRTKPLGVLDDDPLTNRDNIDLLARARSQAR